MIVVPLPIETERLLVRSFVPDSDSRPMLSVYCDPDVAACLAAGLTHLATPRIIAVIDSDNEASMRVAARIGMVRIHEIEAHGRPHVLFAARG